MSPEILERYGDAPPLETLVGPHAYDADQWKGIVEICSEMDRGEVADLVRAALFRCCHGATYAAPGTDDFELWRRLAAALNGALSATHVLHDPAQVQRYLLALEQGEGVARARR